MTASQINVAGSRGSRSWIATAWQAMLVWLVWIAMTCNALRFVVQYGSRNLFLDDLWLVFPRLHAQGLTWATLWAQHNEHRNPLPQLLQYGLYRATGDVRSGIWLDVLILSGIACVMIVIARRIRGCLTWTDVFFPVLWLGTGNAESLLMGYQISMMLPTALVSLIMILIAAASEGLRRKSVITCALALLCLPMCGGPGFLQASVLSAWAFATGIVMRKRSDEQERRSGTILMVAAAITVAMLGWYLIGLRNPPGTVRTYTVAAIGEITLDVLGLSLGPAAETWAPWAGIGVMIFALSGLALLVRAWLTMPIERLRAFGLACCFGANAFLALGIGVGRSASGGPYAFPIRYVLLSAPIVCAAYVSWTLYGPRIARSIVRASACVACAAAFLLVGYCEGERMGTNRKVTMDALERDIALEVPAFEIIRRYNAALDGDPNRLFFVYSQMAQERIEPFDRASDAEIRAFGYEQSDMKPSRVEGLVAIAGARGTEETHGLWLAHKAQVFFDVPDSATKMKLESAFPLADDPALRGTRARCLVTIFHANFEGRTVLFMRTLDRTTNEADGSSQTAEIELPAQRDRTVVIQFMIPGAPPGEIPYGRIAGVRFE